MQRKIYKIFLIYTSEQLLQNKKLHVYFSFGNKIENSVINRQEIRFPFLKQRKV